VRHDPERSAAHFLGGAMTGEEQQSFSGHLLRCPDCWSEVAQARTGRSLAESTRTSAPAALRDRVRGLVEAEALDEALDAASGTVPVAGWPRRRLAAIALPAAAAALALVAVLVVVLGGRGTPEPPSLQQAVADYSAQRLPGAQLPDQRAPDLTGLQLQPVGAGGGTYAGLDVDGFAYRDPAGRRVVLYLSDDPFPEAPGAQRLEGADGPWIVRRGAVTVLCARLPHALLVVGEDAQLVRSTASALGVL